MRSYGNQCIERTLSHDQTAFLFASKYVAPQV
jgi:hypothetical protein